MKLAFYLLVITSLLGCSSKIIPLSGKYPNEPFQAKTSKNFQTVWDNLIDLFAQKGLSIKIIDKSSGLITSERTILTTTVEKKNGKLLNPLAYIVVPQIYEPGPDKYFPINKCSEVTG